MQYNEDFLLFIINKLKYFSPNAAPLLTNLQLFQ